MSRTYRAAGISTLLAALSMTMMMGVSCTMDDSGVTVETPATCKDKIKNGAETDVDCGSTCGPCLTGKACSKAADCESGVCSGALCKASACDDHVKNGTETGIDCGGTCGLCPEGQACLTSADCESGVCTSALCKASACDDGVKNGSETDVDCGGTCATKCASGKKCAADADCKGSLCNAVCVPTCTDQEKNNSETDVDCGGGSCPACAPAAACQNDTDCTSKVCKGMPALCQAPTCGDKAKNGAETDVDCGGTDCPACGFGESCNEDKDCGMGLACKTSSKTCLQP